MKRVKPIIIHIRIFIIILSHAPTIAVALALINTVVVVPRIELRVNPVAERDVYHTKQIIKQCPNKIAKRIYYFAVDRVIIGRVSNH